MTDPKDICPNYPNWPKTWEGLPEDVPYGRTIIQIFEPFIIHLIEKGLTKKTISRHMDNLWFLGGEIIREVCMNEAYETPPSQQILESVDASGGPYCRHLHSPSDIKAYDATCKKLHQFLTH